ncbi:MAG: hypothetical protein JWP40_26 [Blastococcus sp.]|jgi:hypothetical protein|nr:hypothetical protein [Blastococcus sp.]
MLASVAVRVFLLGVLTLLGTVVTLHVAPLTPRNAVPICCRRRVDAFAARARLTLLAAGVTAAAGALLLLVGSL